MALILAGYVFGGLLGFLSWQALMEQEKPRSITLQSIKAFLSLVVGTTILSLFPSDTSSFPAYVIGIASGFFFTPIQRKISTIVQHKEKSLKKERLLIHAKWWEIRHLIYNKLLQTRKAFPDEPLSEYISIDDLEELDLSRNGKITCMRRFAKEYTSQHIEFRFWKGTPILIKHRH